MRTLSNVTQVGLDNHREFASVSCRDGSGKIVRRFRLSYRDRAVVREQLAAFAPGTPVVVEGTFGWSWICQEISEAGLSPRLASSRKVDAYRKAKSTSKSNRIDADLLAELPLTDPWWQVWLPPMQVQGWRELLRYRMSMVKGQTQTKNRIHAALHRHGILHGFSDLFGVAGRKFLALLTEADACTLPQSTTFVLRGYLKSLDDHRRSIAQANRQARPILCHCPVADRLLSLPGIGFVLAYTILAEVGDFSRFRNGARLCSYSTLAPRAYDSGNDGADGQSPIGRHIGHAGRRALKWAWIEAAHGAVKKDAYFRDIFNRRTNNGKRDKNRGYIVVARQLCRIAYVCIRDDRNYREPAKSSLTTEL
ncbi:MAG: IS110 family transposase [Gammaproteobacteria bacterium]